MFVADNSVKIVQVFQGLNCSPKGGITYDSELARTVATTSNALIFVTPSGGRFSVQVKAIAPKKTEISKALPLPRVVTYRNQTKTGMGLSLAQVKKTLQGGRQDNGGRLTEPICDEDGGNVNSSASHHSGLPASLAAFLDTEPMWKAENVRSAGPPDSATI